MLPLQARYWLGAAALLPALPYFLWRGKKLRAEIPELPEAGGPQQGVTAGASPPFRLLVLGESTMAGVGVRSHEEGFTGFFARALSQQLGREVHWQVLARSGYTAHMVKEELVPQLPATPPHLLVIGLGGNDTFKLNSPRRWRRDMLQLMNCIRHHYPHCPILIINLPPVGNFPAFPPSFQRILGTLVLWHGRAIRSLPQQFDGVYYMSEPIRLSDWLEKLPAGTGPEAFFSDGVHPSGLTYRLWAEEAVAWLADEQVLTKLSNKG